ncbi:MAG TPA: methyltransferase domain-containing protein [bacterium]|nr:methyltransferase domain-containing protein [bacterium]
MMSDAIEYLMDMWPLSTGTEDHLTSHHLLLRDSVRNEAFQEAIRRIVNPGDLVLDVGAGTGILSAFAIQAGAQHVYLVESEDTLSCARQIFERAGWLERATFIRGMADRVTFQGGKVDAILIELIGNFGIDENILDVIPTIRKKALKKGGKIIPSRLRLFVVPIMEESLERELGVYRSVRHGIDFSPLAPLADNNVYLLNFRNARLLAEPQRLAEFDFLTCEGDTIESRVNFSIKQRGRMIGFVGWFEIDLCEGISLSNLPNVNRTHWDQIIFPIGETQAVEKGDRVSFRFRYRTTAGEEEWAWSGTIQTRAGNRRFDLCNGDRFLLPKVRTRHTIELRIAN